MKAFSLKTTGLLTVFLFLISYSINSQVLISNTTGTPDASAMLEVKSTTGGILIPRMTTVQRTAIDNGTGDPTEGLLVFDTDDDSFYIFENGQWTNLSMSAEIWSRSSSNVYLTDSEDNVGIGTSSPGSKLVIQADGDATDDDVLFKILNNSGDPVFEVTSAGVRVYVMDAASAATGGFAVGEYNTLKNKGITPCFSTDPDSTRIYSANSTTGGFAVGEYNTLKGAGDTYMFMIPENYFIGHQSGELLQTGTYTGRYNTFFGYQTGQNTQEGSNNVFIGYEAGIKNSSGQFNVLLGSEAGYNITTGSDNVLLGYQAGYSVNTAGNNISIGSQAGFYNTNNSDNIFLGRLAGYNHVGTGTANSAINNIYIGLRAGNGSGPLGNRGNENVFVGTDAGQYNYNGTNNIFLGNTTGYTNYSGSYNVYVGDAAGYSDNNSVRNVYIGYNSGYASYGDDNVLIGTESGRLNQGDSCILIGNYSGYNQRGNNNIIIGNKTAYNKTQGDRGIFIGNAAAYYHEINNNSVFIGDSAGYGYDDGYIYTYPSTNILIGPSAGFNIGNSSSYNVAVGAYSGFYLKTGSVGNVLMGHASGRSLGNTSGNDYNVMMGYLKGVSVEGNNNVLIGAGSSSSGTRNITGSVHIGYQAGDQETISGKLYIDNSNTSEPLIYGNFVSGLEEVRINGDFTFNAGGNSVTMPTDRGTTGYVLATNASSGQAYWTAQPVGESTTAGNGLTKTGNHIKLGGTLTEATTINQSTYNMTFNLNSSGDFEIQDNGSTVLFVQDDGRIGIHNNAPSYAVQVDNTFNDRGIYVTTTYSGNAYGVSGIANGTSRSYGVSGSSGNASSLTANYGVYGSAANSADNYGVYGVVSSDNTSNTNYGVRGQADGDNTENRGVYGYAYGTSSVNYGVYGYAWGSSSTNWAGYFNGDVYAGGNITTNEDSWIGLSSSTERMVFNGSSDRIEIQGADLYNSQNIYMLEDYWIGMGPSIERIAFNGVSGRIEVWNSNLYVDQDIYMTDTDFIGIGSSSERITFDGTNDQIEIMGGDVGIGTTDPEAPLDVESNASGYAIHIEENGTSYTEDWQIGVDADGDLNFFDGTTECVTFEDNGDVGIGTASPSNKLHVVDDYRAIYATAPRDDYYSYGVYGTASGSCTINYWKYGLYGTATGTGTSGTYIGVYGTASGGATAYAGYFSGDVNVTGSVLKSKSSVKIDHPSDPENKFLYHSSVESPDMMNIYNGNIILDSKGEAIVKLPDYFEDFNMEFRYQLTAIGAPGPNLYIKEKIKENQFKIAGGTSGMEVSWMVTGIRHDPYAEQNRIEVEVDKNSDERGKYINPDVYNQPEEKAIDYKITNE